MMQGKSYRLHFVGGDLAGRSFVLQPEGLLIGSSRSAAIRPGSPEIMPEHAMVTVRNGRAVLEARAETVFAGAEPLAPGATRELTVGDTVRLGGELAFVLEEDDGLPAAAFADADGEETADDLAAEAATADGTEAAEDERRHTRYASELELADLRSFVRRQTRRQKVFFAVSVTILLLAVVGGFLYAELYQENPVTWPGELNGQYHDGEYRIELKPAGKFMIYFPECKMTRKQENGNCCEVMTLLGKNLDVPFHLRLIVNPVPDGFITPRRKSFERWRAQAAEKQGFSFLSLPEDQFYATESCGYPYYTISYKRADGNFHWQGFASYLRYHDQEIIFLKEVPLHHFWRTERVLNRFNCFVAAPDAVKSYWEIPETMPDEDMFSRTSIYKSLLGNMRGSLVACSWPDMNERFALLLSSAGQYRDTTMMNDALGLWQEYRDRQQAWYQQACLAYQMYDLQNNMEQKYYIITECLRKFPTPDDYRHIRIIENNWTIVL